MQIARLFVPAIVQIERADCTAHERDADPVALFLHIDAHRGCKIAPSRRVCALGVAIRRVSAVGRLGGFELAVSALDPLPLPNHPALPLGEWLKGWRDNDRWAGQRQPQD